MNNNNHNNNLFKFIYFWESSKNLHERIRAHFDGKELETNTILRNALKKEAKDLIISLQEFIVIMN